jgi:hypothetical protein
VNRKTRPRRRPDGRDTLVSARVPPGGMRALGLSAGEECPWRAGALGGEDDPEDPRARAAGPGGPRAYRREPAELRRIRERCAMSFAWSRCRTAPGRRSAECTHRRLRRSVAAPVQSHDERTGVDVVVASALCQPWRPGIAQSRRPRPGSEHAGRRKPLLCGALAIFPDGANWTPDPLEAVRASASGKF